MNTAYNTPRHFISLADIAAEELRHIVERASDWKRDGRDSHARLCTGGALATLFDKPSTRTRISFSRAAQQLGMDVIELDASNMHFQQGKETLADTARMFNSYIDVLMYRTDTEDKFAELMSTLTIPLINGLSNHTHPCQAMADVMTMREHFADLNGLKVLWIGDYNNVARSWAHAAAKFGFVLHLASPEAYALSDNEATILAAEGAEVIRFNNPSAAAQGVKVVGTDVWVSMGDGNVSARNAAFVDYQVSTALMRQADDQAIFLHCLPANRGQEVTDEVLDSAQSAAWQQAENRLHVQKAILAWCVNRL